MQRDKFWSEVRRRRNHLLLAWWGWFVVGAPLWWSYCRLLSNHNAIAAAVAALVTWGTLWSSLTLRLRSLRCYRCGDRAFAHPYFSMPGATCGHCGARH